MIVKAPVQHRFEAAIQINQNQIKIMGELKMIFNISEASGTFLIKELFVGI